MALGLLFFIAVVVWIGRDGYSDNADGTVGVLDALYYASVSVTTTGYGDIAAVTPTARLATLVLITPARILFLILLVGTTVEVLTERSRTLLTTQRWRRTVRDHHLICGYGSTGQAATKALLVQGVDPDDIVVVDTDPRSIAVASEHGIAAVRGDASRVAVLRQAAIETARWVIVTPNRDDTAVLVTLTARELNPTAHIVAAVREQENLHLLRQSGADAVIDSSAAVGRLLGMATRAPSALEVIDDLLEAGTDLELVEVAPVVGADGLPAAPDGVSVIEILRNGDRVAYGNPEALPIRSSDRLVIVRSANGA